MARFTFVTGFVLVAFLSTLSFVACGGSRQAPLTSTATSYRLCQLDLHCPGGMYCSAGVCDFDCKQDSDCASGQSCDLRGRCDVSGAVTAPPAYAGHLVAPPSVIELSPANPTGQFTLQNDGVEAIGRFHVISDDPNVSATPSSGMLASGESAQIQLQVAAGFVGTGATIHVLTTGGRADVGLVYGSTLSGRLVGTVDVQAPFALGSAPFALEIGGSPDAMTGAVDGTASLLWPVNAQVAATDNGTSFTATFSFVADSRAPGNPLFDVAVQRTIELAGTHSSATAVSGTYTETVLGLPGGAEKTSGAFQLQNSGPPTGVKPAASPALGTLNLAPLPNACSCTASACPGTPTGNADWFFTQGFAFEDWSATDSYEGPNSCLLSSGALGACIVPNDIECALGGFAAIGAEDGVVDVWRAQATYALLSGKTVLANELQPIGAAAGSTSITQQIAALGSAVFSLDQGLHASPAFGEGLLASANLSAAMTSSAKTQFGIASGRDTSELDDVQRFGGVVATMLFAASEQVDSQQRNAVPGQTVATAAQNAASGALLDLGAIGKVLGNPSETIYTLASSFAPLVGTFDKVQKGLNAVGFTSTYVPFIYNPTTPLADLYSQVQPLAVAAQKTAANDEGTLIAENQMVASADQAIGTEIDGITATENIQIATLCGAPPSSPLSMQACEQGGQMGVDFDNMSAAATALQAAKDTHSAAVLKLNTLNQQAQQELNDQADELAEVDADNNTILLIDTAKAQQQQVSQAFQCVSGILFPTSFSSSAGMSFSSSGMPFSSCMPFVESLATNPVNQTAQEDEARADEQVTIMLGSQQVTDAAMVISVQDAQAALTAAGEDVVQQTELFDAATEKLSDDWAQLQQALDNASQGTAQAELSPATDPSFRLLQNAELLQWAADMRVARQWCFLTAQALSYTLDASVTEAAECLAAGSASDLSTAIVNMTQDYDSDAVTYGTSDERQDLISMQADIFGITGPKTDPITGQTLTPAQQFQALLALPTNRDSLGNVQLEFSTSIAGGNPIFSTDVGVDVIETVEASLVGSQLAGLTAYLTVTQSGNSRLRSYVDGSLTAYNIDSKTAEVPAGINLSSFVDPSITPSTDLFGRSVDDSGWTLALDQQGDPRNAAVVLGDIEDIQLWIDHRARTIQGAP